MRITAFALLLLVAPVASARDATVHAGTMTDGSLYFDPRRLTAEEGEHVFLTLVNDDPGTPHDWALLEYGGRDIEAYVPGGQTRSIDFIADQVGTFRIVCQVVGHKQQGMEGELVVEGSLLSPIAPALLLLCSLGLAARLRRRA